MDVILRDSQLDTMIKMMKVIVPKLEYAEVWEGNAKLVKKLETVPMTAAKKILWCSKTASNTTFNWGSTHLKQRDDEIDMAL